jgi:amidase
VEDACPDFTDAEEIFLVWRAWRMASRFGEMLQSHRHLMKDTLIWNTEEGLKLTGLQVAQAEVKRTRLYHRMREFMQRYEFLICPVAQVPPFAVQERWVRDINGIPMKNYIDWNRSTWYITITGHPCISVPGGFTAEGLPVGLQIVGRHQDDFGVLQLAHAFEQVTGHWRRHPALAA